jgi:hypothetical protein
VLLAFPGNAKPLNTDGAHAPQPSLASSQQETTRNPHGPLNIPCENCHTSAGWRPIRTVPEFDHNKTKYPLRGMHEKVPCTQCHVKPVFANVGKNCADCHADIHRRQMGPDCAQCHTVQGWNIAVQQVRDHQNRFPLFGAHAAVQCDDCHKQAATGIFLGLSTACDSCHLKDWQNTTNPPHASAGTAFASANCQGCHNFDSWLGAKFDHSTTGFLLTNGHANLACTACHINNNYNLQIAPTACGTAGCHLTTWQQTNNPPHPQAGPAFAVGNCSGCHNTVSWTTATFDHSTTGFLLTNGHANVPCASCHVNNNYNLQIAPTNCGASGCHLTTWQQTTNPPHPQAGSAFGVNNCSQCHNTVSWTTATFDHSTTGFLLTNGHANVPCASCHVNNNYNLQIAPTNCGASGCHLTTWQQTNNPVHSTSGAAFGVNNCSNCHTTQGWDAASFDHSVTGFALTGTHMSPSPTPCASCHVNNNYTLNSADCMGCHQSSWLSTQTLGGNVPNHVAANFPTTAAACSTCHSITTWANGVFDHSSTGFPLTNSHQMAPAGKVSTCTQCHVGGNYALTSANTDCYGCHQTDWNNTQTLGGNVPNHVTAGFPTSQCSQCHDTISFADATFNHNTTGFALTGTHATTPCASCHTNNNYALTSANTDCMSCHQSAWLSTQTLGGNVPNHVAANFPVTAAACSTCHTITVWANGVFDHSTTGFPLTNSHQMAPAGKVSTCTQCHVGGNYALTSANTDCYGCHQTDWNSTQTLGGNVPNHVTAGFPTSQCSTCHDTISFADATFNHNTTGFALTGTHATTPCSSCHVNGNYALTSANTDCMSCHQSSWLSTQTLGGNVPNHVQANFPVTAAACSTCHTITVWANGVFDHSTTGFPLTNSHQLAPAGKVTGCAQCHVGGNYGLTSANTDCYGCHQTDWNNTQTLGGSIPNHVSAGFPTSLCSTCHDTISFADATFNHSNTGFALAGTHATTPCASCHVSGNYSLTSANTDCMSCHQSSWLSTQTLGGNVPNHVQANFPVTAAACSGCHPITTWAAGMFDHSTTGFTLTGAHQMVPAAGGLITACTQCHVGGNYALTAANAVCYSCHLADWNSTQTLGGSIPNHIAAGYPTTCDTCHTTTSWLGATFNHTYFPIPHHGSVCSDCHQVSTNYATFTCINCHTTTAHQQTQTNNQHNGVGGYTYGPTTCYTCHKNGGG